MILAILQARMSSSRLPGKVLLPIVGQPMLALQIERVLQSDTIDHLVIATSNDPSDDVIADFCQNSILGSRVTCYRGSLDDVLARFYQAALLYQPTHVVRLTGDCPLTDPRVIDTVVRQHVQLDMDYSSNVEPPTYPDGLDVEVMKFSALEQCYQHARLPSEREHVTSYLRHHSNFFQSVNITYHEDLSEHRWTVDNPEDYQFVDRVYQALYPKNHHFTTQDVLDLLIKEPELRDINRNILRNEGLKKSLLADQNYLQGAIDND